MPISDNGLTAAQVVGLILTELIDKSKEARTHFQYAKDARHELDIAAARLAVLDGEMESHRVALGGLADDVAKLIRERDALVANVDTLTRERDKLVSDWRRGEATQATQHRQLAKLREGMEPIAELYHAAEEILRVLKKSDMAALSFATEIARLDAAIKAAEPHCDLIPF